MSASELFISSCTLLYAMASHAPAVDEAPVIETPAATEIVLAQAEPAETSADDLNAAALEAFRGEQAQEGPPVISDTIEAPYSVPLNPPTAPGTEILESYEVPVDEIYPAAGPMVFSDKTDEEVFTLATDYLQGLKTMRAQFVQTAPSGNISTGNLQLSRPGRLRFEYDEPNPTLIVATQGVVYLHDADLETTDSYPVRRTPLKFLLSRRIDTDDAVLSEVIRTEDSVSLTLSSNDEQTEGQLVLVFEAPQLVMRRWAVFDPRGGVTVVDLDNVTEGVELANNAFRVPRAGGSFLKDR